MYAVEIKHSAVASVWAQFASAAITCPDEYGDANVGHAADLADHMLVEFLNRFEWRSNQIEGHPLSFGWHTKKDNAS